MPARNAASGPPGEVLDRSFSHIRQTRQEEDPADIAGNNHMSIAKNMFISRMQVYHLRFSRGIA